MSSSKGVSLSRGLRGIFTPSVLVSFHGTNEACCILFPVCGLCLLKAVLSFLVQLGLPFSVPITKYPKGQQYHEQNPKQLVAGTCLTYCGLGLSSLQEQVVSFFLLFFFFSSFLLPMGGECPTGRRFFHLKNLSIPALSSGFVN